MNIITRPLRQYRLFWRASRLLTAALTLIVVAGPVALVASITLGARLVDDALAGAPVPTVVRTAAWLMAALVTRSALDAARDVAASALTERVTVEVDLLLADTALAPHGVAHLEANDVVTALRGVEEDLHGMYASMAVAGTWQVYRARADGVAALAVVATWNAWAAVLLAAAHVVVAQSLNGYMRRLVATIFGDPAVEKTRELAYRNLTTSREAAKEVRLFDLAEWALGRSDAIWREFAAQEWPRRARLLRGTVGWQVGLFAAHAVVLIVFGVQVWGGRMSAGQALAILTGIEGLRSFGGLGDWQTFAVRHQTQLEELDRLRRRLGLSGVAERRPERPESGPERRGAAAVEVRGVSFSYPTRSTPVFEGLDLVVPAGQSCAVVGVNGAGKSTLISLLAGLHRPDTGQVRIDGADPGADDAARRRVAVIFQDFTRYPSDLLDNVTLALPGSDEDRRGTAEAALDRAAAGAVLTRVGDWDTMLSSEFDGGTDLSGGQWQRIALARALAAVDAGAGLLVLDEPTAALDVRAEAALFDRFLEMTAGVTTLLVSHRLSSVRRADRIVVLDGGQVVEDGTHERLLAAGGPYAEAFTLQASRFAAAGAGPDGDEEGEGAALEADDAADPPHWSGEHATTGSTQEGRHV